MVPKLRIALLVVLTGATTARTEVTLNEILADPALDWNGDGEVHFRDDEWIEIANLTDETVDLTGIRLASADTTWRYEFSGALSPLEVRVVYGQESWQWERDNGHPAFGLRLGNGGGVVGLWRVTETDTVLIEQVSYLDEDAEDDRSTGRSTDDPSDWVLFDALNPYDGEPPPLSSGCDPSPDTTNECLVPTLEQSWGEIKAMYSTDYDG